MYINTFYIFFYNQHTFILYKPTIINNIIIYFYNAEYLSVIEMNLVLVHLYLVLLLVHG